MLEVRKIEKRCTIEGVMFDRDDYLVRIGRYFDRVATDPSGLTFEEWTPPDGSSSFIINATERLSRRKILATSKKKNTPWVRPLAPTW